MCAFHSINVGLCEHNCACVWASGRRESSSYAYMSGVRWLRGVIGYCRLPGWHSDRPEISLSCCRGIVTWVTAQDLDIKSILDGGRGGGAGERATGGERQWSCLQVELSKGPLHRKVLNFFFFFALSLPSSHLSCRNMQHLSIQQQQPNIPTAIYIIDVGEWMAQCGTKNSNMPARSYVVIRQLSEYQMAYLDQLDCFN